MRESPFFHVLLGDAQAYETWAHQIAAGDWVGTGVFYQAPLYPYFLAVLHFFGLGVTGVRVCQALIGAGSCVLLAAAARRLFGNVAGLVAGIMLAVYAPALFFDGLIQKSVLDVFFLCLLLKLLASLTVSPNSRGRWLSAGLALGALSLTRENALLFAAVIGLWLWFDGHAISRRTRLSWSACFLGGLAIIVLPVGVRNGIVGHEFHLTTSQFGTNFYIGNNSSSDGTYVPVIGRGLPQFEQADATAIAEQAAGHPLSPSGVSAYWTDRALTYIRNEPLAWLVLESKKFRLLWNATEMMDTESQEAHADWSTPLRVLGHLVHFGVFVPLALLGIWCAASERSPRRLLCAMLGVYALTLLTFYIVARYRYPMVPFLMLFAAVAIARARRFFGTRSRTELVIGAAMVAAVSIFSNLPVASADEMRAASYYNLGVRFQDDGRLEEAALAYTRALQLEPGYAKAHGNLATVLRVQGKPEEAIAHLNEAVRLHPDFAEAQRNLANALIAKGEPAEAVAHYRAALAQWPDDVDAHVNLGSALATIGQTDEAIQEFRASVALAPQKPDPYYNLGRALLARRQVPEAVAALEHALQIEPGRWTTHYELANAYMAQRQFDRAAAQYRETVDLSPGLGKGYNALGIALAAQGQLDEAIDQFRRALELDPTSKDAQANLRKALAERSGARQAGHSRD